MKTRKSLHTVLSALAAVTALTCIALTPALAQSGGIGTGQIPQIGLPDLTIPTTAAGYSWENVEWIYVANQGNIAAKASTLGVTWSHGRFSKLFTFSVKSLAPGEGIWIRVDFGGYSQFDPGTSIKYQADYYH